MSKAPQWAEDLMLEALKYGGSKKKPKLIWRESKVKIHTSGHCTYDRSKICVTTGSDTFQHKMVILHEVAHVLCDVKEHHGIQFWRTALDLYTHFGLDMAKVLHRERWSKECKKQYDRMTRTETGEI